jgi:hypothetical protein
MPIGNQQVGSGVSGSAEQGTPSVAVPPAPLKGRKSVKGEIKLTPPSKKLKDIVDISPQFSAEAKETHHVFTFGRMNPPTTGHEKLIHKTHEIAQSKGAKAHIVLSHSHDSKKNPIPQKDKIGYVSKIHPDVKVTGSSKESPTFMHHAKAAHEAGHSHLHMVAGSDRVAEYKKTLDKYNGHPDHYNFKSITVHSAGHRDPDGEGTSGISGTKMRDHAKAGDHKSFKAGLPKSLHGHAKQISSHINESMEDGELLEWINQLTDIELDSIIQEDYLIEDLVNERVYTLLQRRKAGIKMRRIKFRVQRMRKLKRKRMADTGMLTRRARRQARTMIRKRMGGAKAANYADLSPSEKMQIDKRVEKKALIINKLAKRLMPKVKAAELIRLRSARAKKQESVNHGFESFIGNLVNEGTTESSDRWSLKAYLNQPEQVDEQDANKKFERLNAKHKAEDEALDKTQALGKEKLKIQLAKNKQSQIRREATDIAAAVDMMIEAIEAIEIKAESNSIDPDLLMIEYVEGYTSPHGKQTPQQGGFAAINKKIAEMTTSQKDKAVDIVTGMKKKASYFKKKYGEKADTVMYATANKLAQEDVRSLKGLLQQEATGAAYMPDAGVSGTPEREITSKAVQKQLNRNRNKSGMKGEVETPKIRYTHDRDRSTDLVGKHKRGQETKRQSEKKGDTHKRVKHTRGKDKNKIDEAYADFVAKKTRETLAKHDKRMIDSARASIKKYDEKQLLKPKPTNPTNEGATGAQRLNKRLKILGVDLDKRAKDRANEHEALKKKYNDKPKPTNEGGNAGWEEFRKRQGKVLRKALSKARDQEDNKTNQFKRFGNVDSTDLRKKGKEEVKEDQSKNRESKMIQLFRMGLAQKGELEIMKRAMKRGDDALKDPKLRTKLYELLMKLIDIVTTDGQIYVKLRQNVQRSKEELQTVEEAFKWLSNTVVVQNIEINHKFDNLFPEHVIKETINTGNDTDQVED